MEFSNIILGTGNYDNINSGNTVSITGDGGNAWGYYGPSYKRLAPKLVTYIPYQEKLEKLLYLKQDFGLWNFCELDIGQLELLT